MTNESGVMGGAENSPVEKLIVGEEGKVLTSGVDSLYLTVDFNWYSDAFLRQLAMMKAEAAKKKCEMPGIMRGEGFEWAYRVHGYGIGGYEWFLSSAEYAVKLGNWIEPCSRPSAVIEIRCETLWLYGVIEAIDRILTLFSCAGATVKATKASRVDLCVDILLPSSLWNDKLIKHKVTRAHRDAMYGCTRDVEGFGIGKGKIAARLYDKHREIREKSKKFWMFDIWQLHQVPDGCNVVRVEFQIRREVITELGMDTIWSFTNHPRNVWAYCTQSWLKFQDRPELHHTQQKTLPFWKTVQNGFYGGQDEQPMLRVKMVNVKREQLSQQLIGQLTSLIAIDTDEAEPQVTLDEKLAVVKESAQLIGMTDAKLSERVRRKLGKYIHAVEKFKAVEQKRSMLGLPQRKPRQEGGAA